MKFTFKTSLWAGFLSLVLIGTATSCKEDEPYLEVNPTSLSFTQDGGSASIQMTTNSVSWQASISGSGFTVSPSSGSKDATLTVTAAQATSPDDVTATLTISSGTLRATVAITQGARNTLTLSGANSVKAAGGSYTLSLQHNTEYSVEIEEAAKSWIQYVGTKALATSTLEFTIAANTGAARTGTVTVKDKAGIAPAQSLTFNQEEDPQRSLLMHLYNSLGGANWNEAKKTNWNTAEPISTWGGVTVNEEGAITKLALNGFGLKGQLDAKMGDFSSLLSLNIGSNTELIGPLPTEIGKLTNLESFLAVSTSLEGTLPSSMGNLTNLTNLQLNNNNITGTIPAEWAGMTALKSFGMFNTKISSPLPKEIFSGWKHIGVLLLHNNPNLTGALPEALGNMTTDNTTFSVQLHNCNFEGGIPASWANIPTVSKQLFLYDNLLTEPVPLSIQAHPSWSNWDKLKATTDIHLIRTQKNNVYLDLEQVPNEQRDMLMALYNALDGANWVDTKKTNWNTDEDISTWGGVTVENEAIVKLNFSGFGLKGSLPKSIGDFAALTSLNLGNNPNLTGPLPEEIGNLTNLTAFTAVTTGLEGPLPKSMGQLTKLTNLQLNNNNITGTIPAEWAGMTALKSFGMFNTKISSPLPDAIFAEWKHLGSILLYGNPNLKGALPAALGNMTTDNTLFSIQMHSCNFTGGIPASWANLPTVSKQLFLYNNQLTEPVPAAIMKHPSWNSWNKIKANSDIHYIRTQQNNVYLELESAVPTLGEVTVTATTPISISLKATILEDGGAAITKRGFELNGQLYQQPLGEGTGEMTATITSLNENSTYKIVAYATNAKGTAKSQEITVTTPKRSNFALTVTSNSGEVLSDAIITLVRTNDPVVEDVSASLLTETPATKAAFSTNGADALVEQMAGQFSRQLKPFTRQMFGMQEALSHARFSSSSRVATKAEEVVDYKTYTNGSGVATLNSIVPGNYSIKVTAFNHLPYYANIVVPEGEGSKTVKMHSLSTGGFSLTAISPFADNTATRAFTSATARETLSAFTYITPEVTGLSADKKLNDITLYPTDTCSYIAIVAESEELAKETLSKFANFSALSVKIDSLSKISQTSQISADDWKSYFTFFNSYAQRVIVVNGVEAGHTNVVNHAAFNMKSLTLNRMSSSEFDSFVLVAKLMGGITLDKKSEITVSKEVGFMVMIMSAQLSTLRGTLMTDGAGPAVTGCNSLVLGSNSSAQTLSDVGYSGNWQVGITVR